MGLMSVAVIAIGRNEGLRLQSCLDSALGAQVRLVVYVDSGSTDDSVQMARARGCAVVCLDMALPFTAARARNEGFRLALSLVPELKYVQFVDGDCEFAEGWLLNAVNYLEHNQSIGVICGRRRERYPEASPYNSICDLEWNTPIGFTSSCGGDAMMRVDTVLAVGGYRDNLIAGEEPEMCVRIRASGWKIYRIDLEMTLHDAAILHFSQWWMRSKRAGHAYFEGAALHGAAPEFHWVKESRRSLLWGGIIPLAVVLCALLWSPLFLLALLIYPLQIFRLYLSHRGKVPYAQWYASLMVVGKFAELAGGMRYLLNRIVKKTSAIIEYK